MRCYARAVPRKIYPANKCLRAVAYRSCRSHPESTIYRAHHIYEGNTYLVHNQMVILSDLSGMCNLPRDLGRSYVCGHEGGRSKPYRPERHFEQTKKQAGFWRGVSPGEQLSPGTVQSGQHASKASRQMPHTSSLTSHFHTATPCHLET